MTFVSGQLVDEEVEVAVDHCIAHGVDRVLADGDQCLTVIGLNDLASQLEVSRVVVQVVVEGLDLLGNLLDFGIGHLKADWLVFTDVETTVTALDADRVRHVGAENPVGVVAHLDGVRVHLPDGDGLFSDEVA